MHKIQYMSSMASAHAKVCRTDNLTGTSMSNNILAMLVPTRIEAQTSEIPLSGDYSLTGVKCDSMYESC